MRSQQIMSRVSAAVAQRQAYKDMGDMLYYSITLILYITTVTLALFLPKNIGPVIDGLGAYAVSSMAFFIPGFFYKRALLKFKMKDAEEPEVKKNWTIANIFIGLGVFNAIMSVGSVVIEVKELFGDD